MDKEKSIKFIEKVIEKTKLEKIKWFRLQDFDSEWDGWAASGIDSFASKIGFETEIYLLNKSSNISLAIWPGSGLSTQFFPDDDNIQSAVIRLYNIVYTKFPNVDKIMDDFINSDDD